MSEMNDWYKEQKELEKRIEEHIKHLEKQKKEKQETKE